MPKKFVGENSKAAVARARKSAKAEEEKDQKQRAEDDAFWKDEDKHVMRKQNRKEEREKKKVEQVEKKHELKKLHDEEMEKIKAKQHVPAKLTRAQIEAENERQAPTASKKENGRVDEIPLEENVNRIEITGDEARSVTEAIQALSVKDNTNDLDRHPEKRVKQAYTAFEEKYLPQLKDENPNLRLSQLKQMLRKDWMKSPENPLNQRFQNYNQHK